MVVVGEVGCKIMSYYNTRAITLMNSQRLWLPA